MSAEFQGCANKQPRLGPQLGGAGWPGTLLGGTLLALLCLPLISLVGSVSFSELVRAMHHPLFGPALTLSLRTTLISTCLTVLTGTPLAWWLATRNSSWSRVVELGVLLPVLMPPAVVGVALLQSLGHQGQLGPLLARVGLSIPFTPTAVVLAQIVVASPFYVQAATNAFRKVEPDILLVARTLGATPQQAFLRIAVPIALPGLLTGFGLCGARAMGEFGATLVFAGNRSGHTQTLPLSIFTALESDLRLAVALSLALLVLGGVIFVMLRAMTTRWWSPTFRRPSDGSETEAGAS